MEELNLSELRAVTQRTQAQIAKAIGTSQSGVSRIERQNDFLISTLRDYVAATGGRLQLVAHYPDATYDLRIPVLSDSSADVHKRTFRVVWQNMRTRQLVHVAWLNFTGLDFVFSYTPEAKLDDDFEPFAAFPDLQASYRSSELFSFFADRLISGARPDYEHVIAALGLTRTEATPVELLARSWGATPHDTIQVVPEPLIGPDGTEIRPFLVSGVRHVDEQNPQKVEGFVAQLSRGQSLNLQDEPDNPNNPRAIVVKVGPQRVGWVPDYLLDYVHEKRGTGKRVSAVVEQASGPETPWHLRLLCKLEVR